MIIIIYFFFTYFYQKLTDVQTYLFSQVERSVLMYMIPEFAFDPESINHQTEHLIKDVRGLVRELHEKLMRGVRGDTATPGEFRRSQNWIGPPGCTLADASFVPPPPDRLMECLGAWESFLHEDSLPPLVHAALAHSQFEAIHPFLDGNGRVGRRHRPRHDFLRTAGIRSAAARLRLRIGGGFLSDIPRFRFFFHHTFYLCPLLCQAFG